MFDSERKLISTHVEKENLSYQDWTNLQLQKKKKKKKRLQSEKTGQWTNRKTFRGLSPDSPCYRVTMVSGKERMKRRSHHAECLLGLFWADQVPGLLSKSGRLITWRYWKTRFLPPWWRGHVTRRLRQDSLCSNHERMVEGSWQIILISWTGHSRAQLWTPWRTFGFGEDGTQLSNCPFI